MEDLSIDSSESKRGIQKELDLFTKPELPPGSRCSRPRPPAFSLPGQKPQTYCQLVFWAFLSYTNLGNLCSRFVIFFL